MKHILNISCYLFVPLDNLPSLRDRIHLRAQELSLLGTVLLAEEGVNVFLAGPHESVRAMVAWLRQDPLLQSIEPKESESNIVPFAKLRVKIKREIIRMNHPTIQPYSQRAPSVSSGTLARWLRSGVDDEGRPIVMLDTRNAFEVDVGRFRGAIDWRLNKFSEFTEAVRLHRDEFHGKTVVSYCTGGIRCEKAALFMAKAGIEKVLQLEGGILKYFEEVGTEHYEGQCFVFDERSALDPSLQAQNDMN
ncbi:MAG: sulfurtransferase [Burkholderiales bacterium]